MDGATPFDFQASGCSREAFDLRFMYFSSEEVRRISCCEIKRTETFSQAGPPHDDGLHSKMLGAFGRDNLSRVEFCGTCGLTESGCPGHMGHIELSGTVYYPFLLSTLHKLLQKTCMKCCRLKTLAAETRQVVEELSMLAPGEMAKSEPFHSLDKKTSLQSDCSSDTASQRLIWEMYSDKTKTYCSEELPARDIGQHTNHASELAARCRAERERRAEAIANLDNEFGQYKNSASMESVRNVLADYVSRIPAKCANCGGKGAKWIKDGFIKLSILRPGEDLDMYCPPVQARKILRELWKHEKDILRWWLPGCRELGPEVFFLDTILVAPSRFRPTEASTIEGGRESLNQQSLQLLDVLEANQKVRDALDAGTMDITQGLIDLQDAVNSLMDSAKGSKHQKLAKDGIRQLFEKKQGLFRMKMMGKRVNFAARSVISPDLNIETTEIGVPMRIASELTYPEVATQHNVQQLRKLVKRGDNYPGAALIGIPQDNGGMQLMSLSHKRTTPEKRESYAKQLLTHVESGNSAVTVWRHIRNGDPLLVNRQPTLHKPGIMAHTVKVLRSEKTIRMHYANCNTYNADFDGDEMNLHAPQDPIGRIEALEIARADQQYLVPTSGKPLRGLIQDHVIAGVMLSKRDTYFSRSDVCELLYTGMRAALEGDLPTAWDQDDGKYKDRPWEDANKGRIHPMKLKVKLDPPALRKPRPVWTGKQIFSMLLKNLITICGKKPVRGSEIGTAPPKRQNGMNFESKSQTPGDIWNGLFDGNKEEANVLFMDTELLMGVLDKKQFGAATFGLIHLVFELVGARAVGAVLSSMSRLFSMFLQMRGFTCAFRDLILREDTEVERKKRILKSRETAKGTLVEWLEKHNTPPPRGNKSTAPELQDATHRLLEKERSLAADDLEGMMLNRMKNSWGDVVNACFPGGTKLTVPSNCFAAMVQTGAKGSKVNQSQITACLGQQELEGRQPPLTVTRRALPCFQPYDLTSRTRGYITDRFLTGIRPQEFFFHCMAGREGLVDTAVKTSRSGYLQRCLVKHLESLKVCYDHSVRDADGSIVQFLYGEDGVEVTLASHLFKFDVLYANFNLLRSSTRTSLRSMVDRKCVDSESALAYLAAKTHAEKGELMNAERMLRNIVQNDGAQKSLDSMALQRLCSDETKIKNRRKEETKTEKSADGQAAKEILDPVASIMSPAHYFGATSEQHEVQLQKFVAEALAKGLLGQKDADEFVEYMRLKFMRCLAQPGEAVGVVAAQSMGEPSTQMTLNTFHLAGHGGANVTLGIPRLREIIQTAAKSNSTPLMKVQVLANERGNTSLQARLLQAHKLAGKFRQVTLLECLKRIVVHDKTRLLKGEVVRTYHVRLEFFDLKELERRVPHLKRERLAHYLKSQFARRFKAEVIRLGGAVKKSKPSAIKAKRGQDEGEDVAGENEGGEGDDKKKAKRPRVGRGLREEAEGEAEGAEAEGEAQGKGVDEDANSEEGSGMYSDAEGGDGDEEAGAVAGGDEQAAAVGEAGRAAPEEDEVESGLYDDDTDEEEQQPNGPTNPKKAKADAVAEPAESPEPKKRRTSAASSGARNIGDWDSMTSNANMSAIVNPGELEENVMSYTVVLKHSDCPHRLLIPEVVHDMCAASTLQDPSATGVKKISVREDKEKVYLECEGVNVSAFHEMAPGTVDVDRIGTNDIRTVLETYGVEAARCSLVSEVKAVFGHYGIEVNHRHLSLIADYMTQAGKLKPFNRLGMNHNYSPLQQMSFETTMLFMNQACQDSIPDTMKAPSSSIVVGQPPQLGTGMVSLLCDLVPHNPQSINREFKF